MPRPRRVDPPSTAAGGSGLQSFGPASFYSSSKSSSKSKSKPTFSTAAPSSAQRQQNSRLRVLLYDKPAYKVKGERPSISLAPRDDAAAFIVDKVVTPFDWGGPPAVGTAADLGLDVDSDYDLDEEEEKEDERYRQQPERQTVKRVLNYVVGWPDEPYARQLVPCTQILDYVSPRVLEEWEYALTERQRKAREAQRARKAADLLAKKKGKEGKVKEEAGVGEMESTDERLAAPAVPHKTKPGRPSQTAAATAARVAAAAARKAARESQAAAKGMTMTTTPGRRPGSSLSARSSLTGLPLQIQLDATPMSVSIGGPPPNLSSPVSEKQHAGPSLKRPFQKFVEQETDDSRGASLGVDTATTNTSANEDEIVDSDEEDELHRPPRPPQTSSMGMGMLPSLRETPPAQRQRKLSQPGTTYIPPPDISLQKHSRPSLTSTTLPQASLKRKRSEETHIPPPTIPINRQTVEQQQEEPEAMEMDTLPEAPEEEEQDLYEVDRLEGDCLTAVDDDGNAMLDEETGVPLESLPGSDGEVVRLFLVRWKGDWPPDQNPTWEPAENLPPRMVRQYLKKVAQKQVGKGHAEDGIHLRGEHSKA